MVKESLIMLSVWKICQIKHIVPLSLNPLIQHVFMGFEKLTVLCFIHQVWHLLSQTVLQPYN
jgi:hypothetical protein